MEELDPMQVVKQAIPGPDGTPQSGSHDMPPPRATIRTEPVPGATDATAAAPTEGTATPEEAPPAPAPAAPEGPAPVSPPPEAAPSAQGEAPGLGPAAEASPGAASATTPEVQERWIQGTNALEAFASGSNEHPLTEEELETALIGLKQEYGFTQLRPEPSGKDWRIHARMNPDNEDDLPTVKGTTELTDPNNPTYEDLMWDLIEAQRRGAPVKESLIQEVSDLFKKEGPKPASNALVEKVRDVAPPPAKKTETVGQVIVGAHSADIHLPEFYRFGVKTLDELAKEIDNIVKRGGDDNKETKNGRAYWDNRGILIIHDQIDPFRSTVFVPDNGKAYYDNNVN